MFDIKDKKENINTYIDVIVEFVKLQMKELNFKYNKIFFNMQNRNMIIRNISVLNVKNKKDIEAMIKFEISQSIPIDLSKYSIKYKILRSTEKEIFLRVVLLPNLMIEICKEITKMLNMKHNALFVNFDIIQKCIELGIINIEQNATIIENKNSEIIINKIDNEIITESYILTKENQVMQKNYDKNLYYCGKFDENFNDIKKLELNKDFKIVVDNRFNYDELEYISSIGMIV
jgi:type IV pilus assembly protein PilM